MSSSPAQLQLSPARSPPFSSAFPRSPRDTPATPTASTCSPHVPPTPPDSSSRGAPAPNIASSPRPNESPNTPSDFSLSTTLSLSAPHFQSRLLDTPIDIHSLAPELDSPAVAHDSTVAVERNYAATLNAREQGSPTPTQETMTRKTSPGTLPPAFVPASTRSQLDQEEASVHSTDAPDPNSRPPNVYINGLPPNFPEDDLLAMTRPFGPVLSVRTFTRHVSDKPSGYGFVLFETYASAEKCIESLRKYRNLHPSFSKQVHKIPGTAYASVPPSLSSTTGPADSFKAKMEQLGDTGSTNLYMEGLPLSITEATLSALVTPYRIMSSRFFHTRLSSPPRIIAFVRLESRSAAEDIVERLHGRLVRGWNDAGCRISVRFADTAEQRELRRTERHSHEGEQSPARLTMARAALLNLKGTQYQATGHSPTLTDIDLGALSNATSPNLGHAFNPMGLAQLGGQIPPLPASSPLTPQAAFSRGNVDQPALNMLGVNIPGMDAFSSSAAHASAQNLRLPQQLQGHTSELIDEQTELQLALMSMQGLRARAQNGYTPVEQLILQAHARQQRANVMAAQNDGGQGRAPNTHGGAPIGPRLGGTVPSERELNRRLLDFLPQMSEDDFHANAGLVQSQPPLHRARPIDIAQESYVQAGGDLATASLALNLERQMSLSGQQTRQRNHTLATQARSGMNNQGRHIRSSTLPSQHLGTNNGSLNSNIHPPLYDSNISLGSNGTKATTLRTSITLHNDHHASNSKHIPYGPTSTFTSSRNIGTLRTSTLPDTQTLFASKNNVNVSSATSRLNMNIPDNSVTSLPMSIGKPLHAINDGTSSASSVSRSTGACAANTSQDAEDDDGESPVVSPALTYSSRTPASLSPATPYSGFFDSGETFKSSGVGNVGGNIVCGGDVRHNGSENAKVATESAI